MSSCINLIPIAILELFQVHVYCTFERFTKGSGLDFLGLDTDDASVGVPV